VTIKETAESIIKLVNPSLEIKWKTDAPTGDPIRVLSVARAREVLGFLERTTLVDGLSKTINWYQAYSHRN
jgi:nucleoside-diphosphate-sugar epimerase